MESIHLLDVKERRKKSIIFVLLLFLLEMFTPSDALSIDIEVSMSVNVKCMGDLQPTSFRYLKPADSEVLEF